MMKSDMEFMPNRQLGTQMVILILSTYRSPAFKIISCVRHLYTYIYIYLTKAIAFLRMTCKQCCFLRNAIGFDVRRWKLHINNFYFT